MSELKDIRRWKWTKKGFLELDDNGNLCEWDDVKRILDDKDKEIERLKQENETILVGVNLRSPTSDGRFI